MKYRLHIQPEDCVIDHKYSIYENDKAIILANTLPEDKDKPREIVDILNSYAALSSQVEALRKALEEARRIAKGAWLDAPFSQVADATVVCELCEYISEKIEALASIPSPQAKEASNAR